MLWLEGSQIGYKGKVDIEAVSQKDFIKWGIEGLIKREIVIDRLIHEEKEPESPEDELIQAYLINNSINTQEELARWMLKENLDKNSLLARAQRHAKWIKVCEKKYKNQAATIFLKNKAKLDKVSYSLIWIEDEALANEVFVRIKEGECSIDDAILMSTNPPQGLAIGRVGPVKLLELPDALAELLRISQPKQVWPPIKVEKGWAIVKNEKLWPAVFNKEEKSKLLIELGEQWIAEEIKVGTSNGN